MKWGMVLRVFINMHTFTVTGYHICAWNSEYDMVSNICSLETPTIETVVSNSFVEFLFFVFIVQFDLRSSVCGCEDFAQYSFVSAISHDTLCIPALFSCTDKTQSTKQPLPQKIITHLHQNKQQQKTKTKNNNKKTTKKKEEEKRARNPNLTTPPCSPPTQTKQQQQQQQKTPLN